MGAVQAQVDVDDAERGETLACVVEAVQGLGQVPRPERDDTAVLPGPRRLQTLPAAVEQHLGPREVEPRPVDGAEREQRERPRGARPRLPQLVGGGVQDPHGAVEVGQGGVVLAEGEQAAAPAHEDAADGHALGELDGLVEDGPALRAAPGHHQRDAQRRAHVGLAGSRTGGTGQPPGGPQLADGLAAVAEVAQHDARGLARHRGVDGRRRPGEDGPRPLQRHPRLGQRER